MSEKDIELYNEVAKILGTAILKNDRNYTDDIMSIIDREVSNARADELTKLNWRHWVDDKQFVFIKADELVDRLKEFRGGNDEKQR